jgi:tetratricopeptide (TPR) repeat protein
MYCAKRGDAADARKYVDLASHLAQSEEDWHRARIQVKVARVHALLGQHEQATQAVTGMDKAETGKVLGMGAVGNDANSFDGQMKELTGLLATGSFDIGRNALESAARLFGDLYGDVKRRSAVEEKIKASWGKMPLFIRIDLLTTMARSALEHKDQAKALELVDQAQAIVDGAKWAVEDYIPVQTRLARLRFRAGDREKARGSLEAALAYFNAEKHRVLSTARAGTLLAIAEANQETGDTAAALVVYKKALSEGLSNPNGRPRALDLSATCRSLALHAVEPDAELWGRIRKALGELGRPW